MNNLYRELAPITPAAWDQIEDEARRTYKRFIAGRRVVDVEGPKGYALNAVGIGQVKQLREQHDVQLAQRQAQLVVELKVPFTLQRADIDDVLRGSEESDWQPVKDAVEKLALEEDRMIFEGLAEAGILGIIPTSSNKPIKLPAKVEDFPDAVSAALSALRLVGVNGPYALLLSAELFTKVSETTIDGVPIIKHVERLMDGAVLWAPALEGAVLLTTRGGDYQLTLGQDLSIGYTSHDADTVTLYHLETLTFRPLTAEASIAIQ